MRLILASCALVFAGTGIAHAEPRNVSNFTRVSASSGTDVTVAIGPRFSVDVTGAGADRIVTRVSGQTLIVERRQSWWSWGARPAAEVRVTMPRVEGLSASSGADLVATGVTGGALELDSSSGAELRVSGTCTSFTADASSGAELHAQELRCESGNVDASSGADARIFASGRLNVDASSGGSVIAYGNPNVGDVDLSSGGSLRRVD